MERVDLDILIPVFNSSQYIIETLSSIIVSDKYSFRIIIVDDCSVDDSVSIIEEYIQNTKLNIDLYANDENLGIAKTRNKLLSISDAKYVAWLDSDDISTRNRFIHQLEYLEANPSVSGVGGKRLLFHDNCITELRPLSAPSFLFSVEGCRVTSIFNNPFCMSTMMMRRNNYKFNESMSPAEDFEYWSRLILKYRLNFKNLEFDCVHYRVHQNNSSMKNYQYQFSLNKKIVENNLKNLGASKINVNVAIAHFDSACAERVVLDPIKIIAYYFTLYGLSINFKVFISIIIWDIKQRAIYRLKQLLKERSNGKWIE